MVAEFLVVGGPRYHERQILESFKTQEDAERYMKSLGMKTMDEDIVYGVWKTDPARVRKRQSYAFWKKLHEFFSGDHPAREILEFVLGVLDEQRAFGSETKAWYAKESLFYFLKDLDAEDGVDCFVCKVQGKVRELDEEQLQEISDLCLSELDRREGLDFTRAKAEGRVIRTEVTQ
jgi:hypothetical protein